MLKLLWKYVISFFTTYHIGILIRSLFTQISKQLAKQILDPSNQQKTYEFAKTVAYNKTFTNEQKTKLLNDKMRKYTKLISKNITEYAINCLRELTVTAIKKRNNGKLNSIYDIVYDIFSSNACQIVSGYFFFFWLNN